MHFNGINGATGRRLLASMPPEQLVSWIQGDDKREAKATLDALRAVRERRIEARQAGVMGVIHGVDPLLAAEAGWGVIYHPDTPQEVRQALAGLVDARQGKELEAVPGDRASQFRARYEQEPGKVDPSKLPYYLLIVGPPSQISFRFQYGLDAEHAVGRLCFEQPDDYRRYAESVLAYEQAGGPLARERRVAFFSPRHAGDEATALSASELARPLAKALEMKALKMPGGGQVTYRTEHVSGDAATKPALLDLLTRATHPPSLLFTASHGLAYPKGHALQLKNQGAIVCHGQDWPGPDAWPDEAPVPESAYLAGPHLPGDARFDGSIVFAFACYGAGTPHLDDFAYLREKQPEELASDPFAGDLPQRLLAQGALAFVGHVDRAWGYSFIGPAGRQIGAFQYTLEAMLAGEPVGHAFEYFNDRYAEMSRQLTEREEDSLLSQYLLGEPVEAGELAELWIARNDARAYVVFGDPYVRLKPALMAAA
jgi:hypothetical protein